MPRLRSISGLAMALAALLAAPACDRAVEPYVPGEKPEPPDLTRIFPEGAERSAKREAQATPPGAPPAMGDRGAPPVAAAGSEEPIRGTVSLAPELEGRVPAGAILFLIARRGESGPPLAVQRVASPQLPLSFAIGPEDRMIEQMPFAGPLRITARLDGDGNATTRGAGDLQGAAPGAYEPGASGVTVVIDQVL
jgi:hypothetical protein